MQRQLINRGKEAVYVQDHASIKATLRRNS